MIKSAPCSWNTIIFLKTNINRWKQEYQSNVISSLVGWMIELDETRLVPQHTPHYEQPF